MRHDRYFEPPFRALHSDIHTGLLVYEDDHVTVTAGVSRIGALAKHKQAGGKGSIHFSGQLAVLKFVKAGGARSIPQSNFTPDVLARQVEALAMDPVALNNAAARALSVGRPHAARDLADLVERIGNGVAPVPVGLSPRVTAVVPNGAMPA